VGESGVGGLSRDRRGTVEQGEKKITSRKTYEGRNGEETGVKDENMEAKRKYPTQKRAGGVVKL
jgi:hypothetical protein